MMEADRGTIGRSSREAFFMPMIYEHYYLPRALDSQQSTPNDLSKSLRLLHPYSRRPITEGEESAWRGIPPTW